MTIQEGNNAPDFTLKNTEKQEVRLSDFSGKKNVLLLFFPLAFTGVCTKELCSTRDNLTAYNNLNAEVLAVSVDSPFSLGEFKKANNLNFNLLSDFNKTVSMSYGAYYEDFLGFKGVAKRSAFVIDKNGEVKYAEVLEDAGQLPNFSKIQEALKSLN